MEKQMLIKGLIIVFFIAISLHFCLGQTLYINQSSPACNDSLSRAQNNLSNPWCSCTPPLDNDLMLSNDTLYFIAGTNATYNKRCDITGWTITGNTTISAYPGDKTNWTSFVTGLKAIVGSIIAVIMLGGVFLTWWIKKR